MKITIHNYRQFKPSELIRSFKDHLDFMVARSKRLKKPIDLAHWNDRGNCLGCLGGHAAMCMAGLDEPGIYLPGISGEKEDVANHVAAIGNALRTGDHVNGSYFLSRLYPEHRATIHRTYRNGKRLTPVYGMMGPDGAEKIANNIATVAEWLEAEGI